MPEAPRNSLELARLALDAIAAKQGRDPAAYDLRDRSLLSDYAVLATGQNTPHLKALANEIRLRFKAIGLPCLRASSRPDSGWIIADYFDIVIHLFLPELRAYYALDELLGKTARRLE